MNSKRPDASSSSHDIEIGGPSETDSLLDRGRTRKTPQTNHHQPASPLPSQTSSNPSSAQSSCPPISVILPINKNIEEKFAVLRPGPKYNASSPAGGYNTLHQAQADGAVVMAYGSFIYQMVSFTLMGFSLYGLAHVYTLVSHDPIIKYSKKCPYCLKRINEKANAYSLADVSTAVAGLTAEKTSIPHLEPRSATLNES
ncbi:large conductance mechanosensitive channel [Trichoderma harzianum]|uniref:Large conductance mechanosensitive channel n=1 Tax=Trichoderma harzianum TaxID=5544 RepID=A0A0F9XRG8_TRIHA|nr:large conductance mechanosensitive channel [Trichoderma harzianum]